MRSLRNILTDIANGLREKLYGSDSEIKIKASEFSNAILLIADYGFAENMVDSSGLGVQVITSLYVDETITSIGDKAFKKLGVTEVFLHDKVQHIGKEAFMLCESLKSIDLRSVKTIGTGCFSQSGIVSITIPETVEKIENGQQTAFAQMYNLVSIVVDGNNPIFYSNVDGQEYNICIQRTYGKYSNALMVGCKNSIIPDGVTYIHSDSLAYGLCPKIITFPTSITYIASRAFISSKNITSIEVKSSITYVQHSFSAIGTIDLIIPDLSIWLNSTFNGISSNPMESGVSSKSATSKLYLRKDENYIEEVTELEIPTDITTIGRYSFIGCASLTSVKFHAGVTEIADNSFAYCSNVNSYDFSSLDAPPTLADVNAFEGNHPTGWKIIVKKDTLGSWKSADNWSTFTNIEEAT